MNLDRRIRLVSVVDQELFEAGLVKPVDPIPLLPSQQNLPEPLDPSLMAPGVEGDLAVVRKLYAPFLNDDDSWKVQPDGYPSLRLRGVLDDGSTAVDRGGVPFVAHVLFSWQEMRTAPIKASAHSHWDICAATFWLRAVVETVGGFRWQDVEMQGLNPPARPNEGGPYLNLDAEIPAGIVFRSSPFATILQDGLPQDLEMETGYSWARQDGLFGRFTGSRLANGERITLGTINPGMNRYSIVSRSGERWTQEDWDALAEGLRPTISGPGFFRSPTSQTCLLYTSPSPRDRQKSRMPSSA